MVERDKLLLASIAGTTVLVIITSVFGFISHTSDGSGLFRNNSGSVYDKNIIQFAPNSSVISVWSCIVYTGMLSLYGYVCANIFRTNKEGKFYCNPAVVTIDVNIVVMISLCLHILQLFLWDKEKLIGNAISLAVSAVINWFLVVVYSVSLYAKTEFLHHHARIDLWIYRLMQNFLASYAAWTSLEFFIKFSIALAGNSDRKDFSPTPSAIGIILLTYIAIIPLPFELLIWDRYFRYIVTPYFVYLVTIACIYSRLSNTPHKDETVKYYALVLMVILAVIFLVRTALAIFRHINEPLVRNV